MLRYIYLSAAAIMTAISGQTQDLSLTPLEVMKKNDLQAVADNEYFRMSMKLINKSGMTRERQLEQHNMTDEGNNRSYLIKFISPADIKGTGFLSIEHDDRESDQWLYLPAFNKTRRISSANESDYFAGTDFTFEDLNREDLEDFNYSFLPDVEVDGAACYQILAIPTSEKKIKESGYSKRELLIRKSDYVLAGGNLYDKSGDLQKVFHASNFKKEGGRWRAYCMEMKNMKQSHSTILIFDEIRSDQEADKEIFTERFLTR
jgi:hypothetical protein